MNILIRNLETYFKETLDITLRLKKMWVGTDKLPFYLQDRYEFYQIELLNQAYLIMLPRGQTDQTPAMIRKHLNAIRDIWKGESIYVDQNVSAYNRKRMIAHKVPFVVPGNQMYLPMYAIDLREHFRAIHTVNSQFSPSTQTVLLNALLNNYSTRFTPTKLSGQLGYTPMTISRAFSELEAGGVGIVKVEGRERVLYLEDDREKLWNQIKELMRNPVKRYLWIEPHTTNVRGVIAGLSALSSYTMLAAPMQKTFAFSLEEWKVQRQQNEIIEVPSNEIEAYRIEIWHYTPLMFTKNDIVDRFSLYLSIKDDEDERVQLALNELMEDIKW